MSSIYDQSGVTVEYIMNTSKLPTLGIQVLLAYILDVDKAFLFAFPKTELTKDQYQLWQEYEKEALKGVPLAYVLGEKEFYGRSFKVDKRVLIPRPETEGMIELALQWLVELGEDRPKPTKILEVGVGSGAIMVTLVQELMSMYEEHWFELKAIPPREEISDFIRERYEFTATDLFEDPLEVAKDNAKKMGVDGLITFKQGDLFEPVNDEKFHIILANLPYLPTLEASTNVHEPQVALDGGASGDAIIERFVEQSKVHILNPGLVAYETYDGEIIYEEY